MWGLFLSGPEREAETITSKIDTYESITGSLLALAEGEDDNIAKMATIACELFHGFEAFHWVGFYRNMDEKTLKIGPYQGTHGCLTIDWSRGVCGACARTGKTQIIHDVNAVEDHIACSPTTRSEIVAPVHKNGKLIAVLDIDSDNIGAFDEEDAQQLEKLLAQMF